MEPTIKQPASTESSNTASSQLQPQKKGKTVLFALVIVVLAIATASGVYAWQHNKVDDLNNKVSSLQSQVTELNKKAPSQSTPAATTKKYLTITQWNVRMLDNGKFTYTYALDGKSADISAKEVTDQDSSCTGASSALITRYTSTDTFTLYGQNMPIASYVQQYYIAKGNKNAVKLGDYYYLLSEPQSPCTTNTTVANTQSQTTKNLETMFLELEQY